MSAKVLAARHHLPSRQLEPVLQALAHAGIFKGIRGPTGGSELVDAVVWSALREVERAFRRRSPALMLKI